MGRVRACRDEQGFQVELCCSTAHRLLLIAALHQQLLINWFSVRNLKQLLESKHNRQLRGLM